MESIIKNCGCGRSYTRAEWAKLPDATVYDLEGVTLEQRRCLCGSHIVIVIAGELAEGDL
jgi:hypothetical protein